MRAAIIVGVFCLFITACRTSDTGKVPPKERITQRALFYNVENLFDTLDQEGTRDGEFTPAGAKNWKADKYRMKVNNISMVFATAFNEYEPLFIGLCEIENRRVLLDLTRSPHLQQYGLNVVHYESPDTRGIDVAMLYNPSLFTPIHHEPLKVIFPDSNYRTRDILYVTGHVLQKDTFHIFINHWPSRRGGLAASEPKRIQAAQTLKAKIDSIISEDQNAGIIIVGDFNDEPWNSSLSDALKVATQMNNHDSSFLYNMMADTSTLEHPGTYKYRDSWNMLDQFIVSSSLLNTKNACFTYPDDAGIINNSWFLMDDDRYPGKMPVRTYLGDEYLGGPSDHLAIYLDLHIRKK